jgi:hypothetical protein
MEGMMPDIEEHGAPTDRNAGEDAPTTGGGQGDYGGMDQNLDRVDLAGASEVGSDPPGGLGTDLGGGSGEIGEDESAASTGTDDPA